MGLLSSKNQQTLPFIPECELLYENGPDSKLLFKNCKKNPGHPGFIPVSDFSVYRHLSPQYQTEENERYIKEVIDRTVKIIAKYTTHNRPAAYPNSTIPYPYNELRGRKDVDRCGTGFITSVQTIQDGSCPCTCCKTSETPVTDFLFIDIRTAAHVIFDDSEAETVVCELFYDTEERESVKCIYGIQLESSNSFNVSARCHSDTAYVTCVSHDLNLINQLPMNTFGPQEKILPLIVSHPHGRSKHVTRGSFCQKRTPIPPNIQTGTPLTLGLNLKCRLFKNAKASSASALQRFLNFSPCQTGVKYSLKESISIILPPDATFLCEKWISEGEWVTFPQETRFSYGNETTESLILQDVEFLVPSDAVMGFYTGHTIPFFVIYDTDTCPGSSGAKVLTSDTLWENPLFPYVVPQHSGALKGGRLNRSGQFPSTSFHNKHMQCSALLCEYSDE